MNMESKRAGVEFKTGRANGRRGALWGGAALVLLATIALSALTARSQPPPREIVLVARGMAFYVEGESAPNPTLRLRAGERVRLVLRNAEPGVTHDFAVDAWDVWTVALEDLGVAAVVIDVPQLPGASEYVCRFHTSMMRGVIEVY